MPHKSFGVECNQDCKHYVPTNGNVLIIKLGAMGDVIRTTPLLDRICQRDPEVRIFWLTRFPEILPKSVDWPIPFTLESITWLRSIPFKLSINLDKDPEACAILDQCQSFEKAGFGLTNGMPGPINKSAEQKFLTGISDEYSRKNKKHYLEEIFEICGWNFDGEHYQLPEPCTNRRIEDYHPQEKVIGLNTGCGSRWKTRLWPEKYWIELSRLLLSKGFRPILLGGPDEDEKNARIASTTGADYLGVFPILEFIGLMEKCELVVSAVTMAMHIAIGLNKPLVLFNNIFNPCEFYFYQDSIILSPSKHCDCFYLPECLHGESCMKDLSVKSVFEAVEKLMK
ncbi:MAG: glycosyltransferase family 9 protein [Fidelibacterota bacterium]